MRNPFKRRPKGYSCYWLALHFPDAEQAAAYYNSIKDAPNTPTLNSMGLWRGGEKLPLCQEED